MGCARHLQWSPVKEESVALSSQGFKGKREKRRSYVVFRFLLLSLALSLLGLVILEMLFASFRGINNFMLCVHQTRNFIHHFLSL